MATRNPHQEPVPQDATPPLPVLRAVWLLRISLVIGILDLFLSFDVFRKPAGMPASSHLVMVIGVFISMALIAGAYLWVVLNVREGRNWARMTVLILVALSVIVSATTRRPPDPIPFALNLLETLLDITALAFVFTAPGAHWFSRPRR